MKRLVSGLGGTAPQPTLPQNTRLWPSIYPLSVDYQSEKTAFSTVDHTPAIGCASDSKIPVSDAFSSSLIRRYPMKETCSKRAPSWVLDAKKHEIHKALPLCCLQSRRDRRF
jgi:hypothetical protein